jgi:hypothetical protein
MPGVVYERVGEEACRGASDEDGRVDKTVRRALQGPSRRSTVNMNSWGGTGPRGEGQRRRGSANLPAVGARPIPPGNSNTGR